MKIMEKYIFLLVVVLTAASPPRLPLLHQRLNNAESNRISNAHLAAENQFPYVISLQKISENLSLTRGHRCGGALIRFDVALTTASCLYNNNNGVFTQINPAEYRVFAGSVALNNDTSADRYRSIAYITPYFMFDIRNPLKGDIAVIRLSSPFPEDVVWPIWMAHTSDNIHAQHGICSVAGWGGQRKFESASLQLTYTNKTLSNQTACALLYSNQNKIIIDNSMVCATTGVTGPTTPSGCQGDSGNPLECLRRHPNVSGVLFGLLTKSNDCSASDNPEVYTRVNDYYGWVTHIINSPPPPPTGAGSTFKPALAMLTILAFIQFMVIS